MWEIHGLGQKYLGQNAKICTQLELSAEVEAYSQFVVMRESV
jgi:hypothetical protein